MTVVLGIDGGGSTLRVAAAAVGDPSGPRLLHEARRGPANPGAIGREASAALIHEAIGEVRAVVDQPCAAVGIGIAGASPEYADDWLRATVAAALPGVPTATATDIEIALVGAHGARHGAIVVAGTGSVALALTSDGGRVQTGGWGYLLGDEGSGYWLGGQALRAVTLFHDTGDRHYAPLAEATLAHIGAANARAVIGWTYRGGPPDVKAIAALAEVVLGAADSGDGHARALVDRAAADLHACLTLAIRRSGADALPIAFGGGLLTADTPISRALTARCGLAARPQARFAPVIGACLLAARLIGL